MPGFELTPKQAEAVTLCASPAKHIMLYGGSRSGKTFLILRNIVVRALKAPGSRHAVLRFRFNHLKASIILDTFPKVMSLCFPDVPWSIDKTDWYANVGTSQVWFGGLDDKDRVDKILGQEHASIFLNECSQISYDARNTALTRLAQSVYDEATGKSLSLKMYYDCNPPSNAHWTHRLFAEHRDPDTRESLPNPSDYAWMQMNPRDNVQNLPDGYLAVLESMPGRWRRRFLEGEFSDANPSALFNQEWIDRWRVVDGSAPDYQRVIVAVDPSGASDSDNAMNDEIGIAVVGLGTDGRGYLIEDLTMKAGPAKWGLAAVSAYDRHQADAIVGETNYGGAMVEHVIKTASKERALRVPFRAVTASRGKHVRAEPISALYETGQIRHVGNFVKLEDELCAFTTFGYTGEGSPNRADAAIWGFVELFPGLVSQRKEPKKSKPVTRHAPVAHGWMGA